MKRLWILACLLITVACAEAFESRKDRMARLEKAGEITEADSNGTTLSTIDVVKPYLRSHMVKNEPIKVVYKAGSIRKHWLSLEKESDDISKEAFVQMVDREKFNAKNFQEYLVWLPRDVDVKSLKIQQKFGKKSVEPYYVEGIDPSSPNIQHMFPFSDKNSIALMVRFKRTGRQIPPLHISMKSKKITDPQSVQFQWSLPKGSRLQ